MSKFTYEEKDPVSKFENFEWDNTWIDHIDDKSLTRVLYIGDSISCGIRRIATSECEQKIRFDGFGTSKGIDNLYLFESIRIFAAQEGYRNAVIFNNGLHGWHLSDTEEYPFYYEKAVEFLMKEFENTPIALVLTTAVADEERNARVNVRNAEVRKIAEKYGLPVIDLYPVAVKCGEDEMRPGGVHFSPEGYQILARCILDDLKNYFNLG